MTNNEISHSISIMIHPHIWERAKIALRKLREIHRDGGGTSRMTKNGDRVTLTLTGPAPLVLDGIDAARKIENMANSAHQRIRGQMHDFINRAENRRRDSAADILMDMLRHTGGNKR